MKRIAVLSDTHGLLRPDVIPFLQKADLILHAGDVDTPAVAQHIFLLGEAHIVRGNNDGAWAANLPHSHYLTVEGMRFFLIHNRAQVLPDPKADVVIFGHSHRYVCETHGGTLWLNPGSCGKPRFGLEPSLCLLTVEDGLCRAEKITFPREVR